MRVIVDGQPRGMRALWWESGALRLIDQRLLPARLEFLTLRSTQEVADAIREMAVRGAPSIGAAAAYGMVLGARDPDKAAELLSRTRPTAVNLFHAIEHMRRAFRAGQEPSTAAGGYADAIVEACARIGKAGLPLFPDGVRALTHCNAGALATVDIGTATAPMRLAAREGRRLTVFCGETRPRLQGHLTAWELRNEEIPATVIPDTAAGLLMSRGAVNLVIVGADRIAANGDVANKIGTFPLAVLAREHGIPFYVAAPASTYDPATPDGARIPIEERAPQEVLALSGVRLSPPETDAWNPAFDVTPARLVKGYVTELGILTAGELGKVGKAR